MTDKVIYIGNPAGEQVPVLATDADGDGYYSQRVEGSGPARLVTVTPTLTVGATYATGDYVGSSGTAWVFAGCARDNGGSGLIVGATLIDTSGTAAVTGVSGELWLFDTTFTPPNDSAAWTVSDAAALTCIGVIPFSTYYTSALGAISVTDPVAIPFKCGAATTSLFGAFVTRGAPAYTTGALTIRLRILQD